jgi:hypothetical protein
MKTTVSLQPAPEVMAAIKQDFECYTDKKDIAVKHGISIYHLNKLFPAYCRNYRIKHKIARIDGCYGKSELCDKCKAELL